jgi:hypothetical protein
MDRDPEGDRLVAPLHLIRDPRFRCLRKLDGAAGGFFPGSNGDHHLSVEEELLARPLEREAERIRGTLQRPGQVSEQSERA